MATRQSFLTGRGQCSLSATLISQFTSDRRCALVLPGRLFSRGQVSLWTSVLCHSEAPRDVRGHKWAKHSSTGHPRADQELRAPTDRGVSPFGRGPAMNTQACRAFLSVAPQLPPFPRGPPTCGPKLAGYLHHSVPRAHSLLSTREGLVWHLN